MFQLTLRNNLRGGGGCSGTFYTLCIKKNLYLKGERCSLSLNEILIKQIYFFREEEEITFKNSFVHEWSTKIINL